MMRFGSTLLLLTALAALAWCGSVSDLSVAEAMTGGPRVGQQNPIVSTGGSGASGSTLTGTVEGIAPPVVIDESATAYVTIRLNGWIVEQPTLLWDEEEQVWTFKYSIPPGQKDAVVTITVTDATTGNTTTQTLIVS